MRILLFVGTLSLLNIQSCREVGTNAAQQKENGPSSESPLNSFIARTPYSVNKAGNTLQRRFPSPAGFTREQKDPTSFASFLRNIKLKHHGAFVKMYNGQIKNKEDTYLAVVDLEIGTKNCTNARMQ